MTAYQCFFSTHQGKRLANEDRGQYLAIAQGMSLVLADGCGGHVGGTAAAQAFCEAWMEIVTAHKQAVNRVVFNAWLRASMTKTAQCLKEQGLGEAKTTGLVAWLDDKQLLLGHVGDTRGYVVNLTHNTVWHTKDHSLAQALVDAGLLETNEAKAHPSRHQLLKAIGTGEIPEPSIVQLPALSAAERLLLCTDGFWELLDEPLVLSLGQLQDKVSFDRWVSNLVNSNVPQDNTSVFLIRKQPNDKVQALGQLAHQA